jgi:hypothetical protein
MQRIDSVKQFLYGPSKIPIWRFLLVLLALYTVPRFLECSIIDRKSQEAGSSQHQVTYGEILHLLQ